MPGQGVRAFKGSGCHPTKGVPLGEGHADDLGAGLEGKIGGGGWGLVQVAGAEACPKAEPLFQKLEKKGWSREVRRSPQLNSRSHGKGREGRRGIENDSQSRVSAWLGSGEGRAKRSVREPHRAQPRTGQCRLS